MLENKSRIILKTILSLFDYSGEWSKPYREAGYSIIQVDIKLGTDIFLFDYRALPEIYGILAAPPCTHFAVAGAKHFAAKDVDGRTDGDIYLVRKALTIIRWCTPRFWCLENPVGRLNALVPELREYGPRYFQPYEYGDPYRKRTGLWGRFEWPTAYNRVEPNGVRKGQPDEWYSKVGGKSERTKEYRSRTPAGFARAFFLANQ